MFVIYSGVCVFTKLEVYIPLQEQGTVTKDPENFFFLKDIFSMLLNAHKKV